MSIFIPLKTDSIIYYNHAKKKRVASPLPPAFAKQIGWDSDVEPVGDSILLLSSAFTGFYRLHINYQTGQITAEEKKYLPGYEIRCLFNDKDGRLWAGTTQGLLKQELTPPPISAFEYRTPAPYTPTDHFTSVYRYKNFLYAGRYSRHHGLSIIDASNMQLMKEIQFFGNDEAWNEVLSIEMYHPDTLWVGTWAGLLWYDTKTERYGKLLDEKKYPWAANFPAILAPPNNDGYAWCCAWLGGRVFRYHIPTRTFSLFTSQSTPALPFEKVKSIVYDSYGDVWIGGHALTRWNSKLHLFDTLINVYAGAHKFNDDIISFSADANGSLWIHNSDNGLLEYKIKDKMFRAYSTTDGLPSALLNSLSNVINNKLWIAGNNKLSRMDIQSKEFTIYDYDDGLPEQIPTGRRIYFDAASRLMYLCSGNYLVRFPSEPLKKNSDPSVLLIEDVTINNDSILFQPQGKIVLSHHYNSLGFNFTVMDFERNSYQFAYRINKGETWNSIGNQHSLSFNNLSPGEYLIEFSALGKPGVRKSTSILVIIKPPFWAQTWFISLSILFIVALFLWLFRARLKRIRQRSKVDRQLAQTQMKALQAQMNPHFIFNSLNSIREMILSGSNKDASHYLSQFAQLIRVTLEQSGQETVSLSSTIDYLQRYIEMEKIRNEFVQYAFKVDPSLDPAETLVSPMIIQPFVENAIWHGVSASRKDITVTISFTKKRDSLECTVEDNGTGINHSKSLKGLNVPKKNAHGIFNVEERIKLMSEKYHQRFSVTISDKKDIPGSTETGTLVTIILPYQTSDL